ncbi:PREDICTED: sorting nexin-8 [Myotis brandtii]|uniref:sorting nexin-8 n=1 Tax=Myotis brandtii TaxID=109478 RepID=UPI0003BBD18D|nr:PREDICTED: sorting nexin-8 [Myotis brandtii]
MNSDLTALPALGGPLPASHTLPSRLLRKELVPPPGPGPEYLLHRKGSGREVSLPRVLLGGGPAGATAEADLALQRFRASVYRRYNDFVVFHALLLQKFPYRMVPALPPKRMLGADREFIEARRRALKRFINLVARHPPFSEDEVLRLFLCFSGPDVQSKLKESAQCVGDEFLNCKLATRAKDFLPADIQTQFAVSRELIRSIYNSFYKLRDRAERMAARAIDNAADLLIFGKELRQVAQRLSGPGLADLGGFHVDVKLVLTRNWVRPPPIRTFSNSATALFTLAERGGIWGLFSLNCWFHGFSALSWACLWGAGWVRGRACRACGHVLWGRSRALCWAPGNQPVSQGKQEEDAVVEKLNLFLDLLQSYKDLCERHEKGVLHKHQRALHKYSLMKRQMSAAVHSHEPESVEQLESRIMEQENAIQTMELRNHFALFCLHQETQLVHAYLPLTSHILGAFVSSQIQGHKEMSKVWNDLKPKLHCLFSGPASALTPPRSPRDGLSPH